LRAREAQLLKAHERAWRRDLPALTGVKWRQFERGFVAGAEVKHGKALRAAAEPLFAAAPVQHLTLYLNPRSAGALAALPPGVRLRSLDFPGARLSGLQDRGAYFLASLPQLRHLTRLVLHLQQLGSSAAHALAASPHLNALETLD